MKLHAKLTLIIHLSTLLTMMLIAHNIYPDEYSETIYPSAGISLLISQPLTPGEPVDVGLTIFFRKGEKLLYPKAKDTFYPLKLIEIREKTRKTGKGRYKKLIIYTLTSYRPGRYTFPSLEIKVGNDTIKTKELVIDFLSVLPRDNPNPELKDIMPIERVRFIPYLLITIVILGIIAVVVVLLLKKLLVLLKPRKKTDLETKKTPEIQFIDPISWIENSLSSLQERIKTDGITTKECYIEISDIIRTFIQLIFSISARQMTTLEIQKELINIPHGRIDSKDLIRILSRSDLVKFAKEEPSKNTIEKDLSTISRIVSSYKREILNTVS
ncbi:MAG: hypothetical protein DRP54_07740 [Spirochaetes bacterium]|nr:MAG: hypothetical protein DRP54_07740 [Spirochaetota bacterium]